MTEKPCPATLKTDRDAPAATNLRPAAGAPEVVGPPHLRQRRPLPQEVRGRASIPTT